MGFVGQKRTLVWRFLDSGRGSCRRINNDREREAYMETLWLLSDVPVWIAKLLLLTNFAVRRSV